MSIRVDEGIMIIIYVNDQTDSRDFYQKLLGFEPVLDVLGMTEFKLSNGVSLGIMSEKGILNILEGKVPDPHLASGIPRSEVYLPVDDPNKYYQRLVNAGGTGISEMKSRNWGDDVAYGLDLDGHILAFAKKSDQ